MDKPHKVNSQEVGQYPVGDKRLLHRRQEDIPKEAIIQEVILQEVILQEVILQEVILQEVISLTQEHTVLTGFYYIPKHLSPSISSLGA